MSDLSQEFEAVSFLLQRERFRIGGSNDLQRRNLHLNALAFAGRFLEFSLHANRRSRRGIFDRVKTLTLAVQN